MRLLVPIAIVVSAVAGCSGSTQRSDAASVDDAFTAGLDAGGGTDAASSGDDAGAQDDAVTPMDDTGGVGGDDATMALCTNSADTMVATGATFATDLGNCAMNTFGAEPGLMNCITGLGLSAPCAGCFDQDVHCTIRHCAGQCAGGNSPQCDACRHQNCDTAFTACSGAAP